MPKGSKKKKAIKRKETANHHPSSTNSVGTQGNGAGDDHDRSDHPLTDEDFSPRTAMETPPDPEPDSEPVAGVSKEATVVPEPEPEPAVSKEAFAVLEPELAVGKEASVVNEPESEPEPAVNKEALVVPVEEQNVSEPEQIEAVLPVASEALDEPCDPFHVEDKSGEGKLYDEQTEFPKPKPTVSGEASDIHDGKQNLSESEQTEAPTDVASKVLEEPSSSFQVEDKSGEGSLYHGQTKVPAPKPVVSREASNIHIGQENFSVSEQSEAATEVASEAFDKPSSPFHVKEKNGELSLFHEQTSVPEAISRDAHAVRSAPLLERRASWWNCCGLLDVFGGAQR